MQKLLYIIAFLPFVGMAQFDFETRYFKMDGASVPEVPEISAFDVDFGPKRDFTLRKFSDFNKITAENYWQPVDMMAALEGEQQLKRQNNYNVEALQQQYNNRLGAKAYAPDGSTKVTNPVYKEQRGLNFVNSCPPFGICPRCAPYRIGRGY